MKINLFFANFCPWWTVPLFTSTEFGHHIQFCVVSLCSTFLYSLYTNQGIIQQINEPSNDRYYCMILPSSRFGFYLGAWRKILKRHHSEKVWLNMMTSPRLTYIFQLHLTSVQFCHGVKEGKFKSLKKYTLIFCQNMGVISLNNHYEHWTTICKGIISI